MHLKFAHYRNRFCMFRTYYALAQGLVKPEGLTLSVIEVPDPPSHVHEEVLVNGQVDLANLNLRNFLRCRLEGAPIVGLATEWKSTAKGNGLFVRMDGPVKSPKDLSGRLIATHEKGAHTRHRYLLTRCYGVDDGTLRWRSHPQEELLDLLKQGQADAAILIDQFFFRGENDPDVRCLYTDGEAWKEFFGFSEIIKHIIAIREPLLKEHPELREKVLQAFRASLQYSDNHLDEIAAKFVQRYGGDREALLASVRYPKIEFTFTEGERKSVEAEMNMLVDIGTLGQKVPLVSAFVV